MYLVTKYYNECGVTFGEIWDQLIFTDKKDAEDYYRDLCVDVELDENIQHDDYEERYNVGGNLKRCIYTFDGEDWGIEITLREVELKSNDLDLLSKDILKLISKKIEGMV